jgi:hypothetical protein
MKRKTKFRYEVSEGEKVTIRVTPVETGARVTGSDNGESLENVDGPDEPTFEFDVDQVPGNSHFVIVECSFLDEDPNTAHFDFELRGSKGGVFKDVVVRKTNQILDPTFRFTVS